MNEDNNISSGNTNNNTGGEINNISNSGTNMNDSDISDYVDAKRKEKYLEEEFLEYNEMNGTDYDGMKDDESKEEIDIPKEKKKKSKWARIIPSALVFGAVAGGIFTLISVVGINAANSANKNVATVATVAKQVSSTGSTSAQMDVPAIANAMMPAMVILNGKTEVQTQSFFGYGQTMEAQTTGTGTIIGKNDDELLILTNAHVVEEINDLQCQFVDEQSVSATIKGSDSSQDVAVVAVKLDDISSDTMDKIAVAQLDETYTPVVGEEVVAIGNANGEGQSVTVGYISALDRTIEVENGTFTGLIMTDAAINSGNSGGALINSSGNVIGINFAKNAEEGVENMAYSIPISKVSNLINSLMTQETREEVSESERGYLGVGGADISSSMSQQYGYPQGLMIREVASGSAAEKAGLERYDIITSFDGKTITGQTSLQNTIKYYKAGETVPIVYYHLEGEEYVEKSVNVTLGSKN